MRNAWFAIVIAAACERSKPAAPFKGPLTVELVMASKDVAKVFEPWDEGFAKLQAKLGPPTKIDGKKHFWAAMQGDDCAYTFVEQEDGKQYKKAGLIVGTIQHPGTYGKAGAIMNRAECLELVGKGVAPEDPNAAGPPADGSPVPVRLVLDSAVKGRSKWDGKPIKITGILNQSGDSAYIYDSSDSSKVTLGCRLDQPDTTTDRLGKQVTLQGTVRIEKLVTSAGEPVLEPRLEHCAFLPNGP